jgi:hypothetical protein
MRVLCLDCDLGLDADTSTFASSVSLYDYDVVFWKPAESLGGYSQYASSYMGRRSLTESESAAIVRDVDRRRTEFKEFVDLGRSLVVFLPGETQVFVDTGRREYSGTGKNRATTNIVQEFDIMRAVPTHLVRQAASGLEISPANDLIASLFRQTSNDWVYRCILESHEQVRPLFFVKGTNKIVGGMIRAKSRGILLLLPELFVDDSDDEEGEADEADEAEEKPSQQEDVGADIFHVDSEDESNPGHLLLSWVESLMAEPDAALPAWAANYRFPTEEKRANEQSRLADDLSHLMAKIDVLRVAQAQDEQWKTLIAGSGASLERRVRDAFEVIGFQIEEAELGRSDLRATYGETLVVVEIKGVSKSAAERYAAQLEKWVSEELAAERPAKGVLVVNTWRDIPLDQRIQPDFPEQMLRYATQREHCLITGLQLLVMVKTALLEPQRKPEIAGLIIDTVGPLDGWDDPQSVFIPQRVKVVMQAEDDDTADQVEIEGELETSDPDA